MPEPGPSRGKASARRLARSVTGLTLAVGLAACAAKADRSGFPALLPIDDLLAQAGPITPDPGPALVARAAAFRARVAAP